MREEPQRAHLKPQRAFKRHLETAAECADCDSGSVVLLPYPKIFFRARHAGSTFMSLLRARLDQWRGRRRQTVFTGNWALRLEGLWDCGVDFRSRTILDVGCNVGIVAYEIAKLSPAMIHGLDYHPPFIEAARQIFYGYREIPHRFDVVNLTDERKLRAVLQPRYDIVLFLSVWQHIRKHYGEAVAFRLTATLAERTGSVLLSRTFPREAADDFRDAMETLGFSEVRRTEGERALVVFERQT